MVKAGLVRSAIVDVKVLRLADRGHERWLRAFMEYLRDNRNGVRYAPGEIHCSGGIEEMADIVVKRRNG